MDEKYQQSRMLPCVLGWFVYVEGETRQGFVIWEQKTANIVNVIHFLMVQEEQSFGVGFVMRFWMGMCGVFLCVGACSEPSPQGEGKQELVSESFQEKKSILEAHVGDQDSGEWGQPEIPGKEVRVEVERESAGESRGSDGLRDLDGGASEQEVLPREERVAEVNEPNIPEKSSESVSEVTPEVSSSSHCKMTSDEVTCPHFTTTLHAGVVLKVPRKVYWQIPKGSVPVGGWPVALMFQGSFFPSSLNWRGKKGATIGLYYQALTLKMLLDAGYAVLTPLARGNGTTFWDTNIAPYNTFWKQSPDHRLMQAIFAAIEKGTFGKLNPKKMFALGISSGGYMTSRMAVSYRGKFRALAIQSASYATCSGPLCIVPKLPSEHPPTLFLHGRKDVVVPIRTARMYHDALKRGGFATLFVEDHQAGHAWFAASPKAVLDWFRRHP